MPFGLPPMSDTEPFQRARTDALRYLSYRPRTEAEVQSRLRRRYSLPLVNEVLQELKRQGLLNDAKFATQWVASRISHKPRSSWVLKRELRAKGVDGELAEQAAQAVDDEESAYRAGLKHAGKQEAADFDTFRRRLGGYLKRRGFSDSVSRRTISRIWGERADAPPGHT